MANQKYIDIQNALYDLEVEDSKIRIAELKTQFKIRKVWITNDKRVVPYVFLRTSHLLNIEPFLKKKLQLLYDSRYITHKGFPPKEEEREFVRRFLNLMSIQVEIKRRKLPITPVDNHIEELYDMLTLDPYDEDWGGTLDHFLAKEYYLGN